jgi:hypothetical protein
MGSMEAPIVFEAVTVRPGDTLIIRLESFLSAADTATLKADIRSQIDPEIKVLLIEAPGGQIAAAKSA